MLKNGTPFRDVWLKAHQSSRSAQAIVSFIAFIERRLGARFIYDQAISSESQEVDTPYVSHKPYGQNEKYADVKDAIQRYVLKRRKDGVTIIGRNSAQPSVSWLFDFRALILQPYWLNRYADIFWERYAPQYPFQVGGIETAGIALVVAIVMKSVERGTPVQGFYLRKSRKRDGLMKVVEGHVSDLPIILVDDLINSGKTLNAQIQILSSLQKRVVHIFLLLAFRCREAYVGIGNHDTRLDALFTIEDFGIPLLTSNAPEVPKESFETLWHFEAPRPSLHIVLQKSAPVLDSRSVFFGSDAGTFYALDQETGEVAWKFNIGHHPKGKGILSSPAIESGVVYFGAYDGKVYALDTETGKVRWTYADADWIGSSPSIAPTLGLLFIGLEFSLPHKQGGIVALSLVTGQCVWEHHTKAYTHGSPLYIPEERMVVIGSNDGVLYAYDAETGAPRWHYQTGGDIKTACAYDAKRRLVLFGSMDGKCYALSASDGSTVFIRQTEAGIYSIPLIHHDTVYIASLDKRLYAIDLDTGKDRWVFDTAGRIFSSPTYIEDSIWVGSNDGRLYEVNPEDGTLRSFFQTTDRIVNKIAYNPNTKRFFVTTSANEVYCIVRKK